MPADDRAMTIHLCAAIRQGSAYASEFFRRIRSLDEAGYRLVGITVTVDGATVEDPALLAAAAADDRVRFIPEGAGIATVETMMERSVGWARAANLALDASLGRPALRTLWVEADLDFEPDLLSKLLAAGGDVVAPRVHCEGRFYDTWGFRTDQGVRIRHDQHLLSLPRAGKLIDLSSVGSCLLFPTSILRRGARLPGSYPDGLLVGFCHAAAELGYRISCAPDVIIRHPLEAWTKQLTHLRKVSVEHADGRPAAIRPCVGLHGAGAYAEFVAPLLRKQLRRHYLGANLGFYRQATFRFSLQPGADLEARVCLAGEVKAAHGFSRPYPVYPAGQSRGILSLADRLRLSLLKRFTSQPRP